MSAIAQKGWEGAKNLKLAQATRAEHPEMLKFCVHKTATGLLRVATRNGNAEITKFLFTQLNIDKNCKNNDEKTDFFLSAGLGGTNFSN